MISRAGGCGPRPDPRAGVGTGKGVCARRAGSRQALDLRSPLAYLTAMHPFEPCIPTPGTKVPAGPDWIHEIKHDGYRLIVQRDGKRVRLFTRNGHDWSNRFPLIIEAALRNRNSSFVIDGEAVLLGVDGRSISTACTRAGTIHEVKFYAFDMLVSDGEDLRRLPLSMRKTNLARILARRVDGIHLAPFEQGEIGPDLFRHACLMGLEGLVSKHKDRPYRAGRSQHWIKNKNRQHPAFSRVRDQFS